MAISLAQLNRAGTPKPPRVLIHGVAGVGKTTLLKSLMGLVPIKTGSVEFDGRAILTVMLKFSVINTKRNSSAYRVGMG